MEDACHVLRSNVEDACVTFRDIKRVGGDAHALSSEAVDGTLFEMSKGGGGRGDEGEW